MKRKSMPRVLSWFLGNENNHSTIVPVAQYKGVFRILSALLKRENLLKVTLPQGCFSRFLNCTNGTKSRKALNIVANL